jgi:hypothetical protein
MMMEEHKIQHWYAHMNDAHALVLGRPIFINIYGLSESDVLYIKGKLT